MPVNETYFSVESTTPLAGNATKDGAAVDCYAIGAAKFRAFASADQTGTVVIQQSADGTTWFPTTTATNVTANATAGVFIEAAVTLRYCRVHYVNGSTIQTAFLLTSGAVAI